MGYRRHSRTSLVAWCLCLLGATALTPPQPAAADRGDEAARAVRRAEALLENATASARTAGHRLATATAALPAAQRRIATTNGALIAAQVEANTARRRADAARAEHRRVAADYQAAEHRVTAARDKVEDIVRASYMGSTFSRISVLVSATGPTDLMDRMTLVDTVVRREQAGIRTFIDARRTARIAQDRSGATSRAAESAEQAAAARLRATREARAAAVRAKLEVQRLVAARLVALRAARSQRAGVLVRLRAALAAEQRVRTALRAVGVRSGGHYGGGRLAMPVRGWKSSDFGNRYDPYYQVWQLHAGTDFAAGTGSEIRAAAAGRVVQAGWNGGYGRYTCIDHGRLGGSGFTTCYGHQSRILVHPGEWVRRGEVIGRVGNTGASTGAHLHFETRFGGEPRNPLNYLPRCLC